MKLLLFLPFFTSTFIANAQSASAKTRMRGYEKYMAAFTFSPLALVQIDNTLMAGAEHALGQSIHATLEAGWIYSSSYFGNTNDNDISLNASGFNIRPGLKFFFSDRKSGYFQPQFFYKQVTHTMYDWLEKDVVNGVAAYEQLQEFKYRRMVHGYHAIFGVVRPLGFGDKLCYDLYAGIGVRYKRTKVVGELNSRYDRQGEFFFRNEEEGSALPSIPFGVRLLFKID